MILLVMSMFVTSRAQKQGYFWYFGKNAALDFTNFDPIPLDNSHMDAPEGVASISDSTGQFLFYTDGVNIWNSNHEKVNTNGLSGDPSSTQSATIVPDPDNTDQYFVFTTKPFITGGSSNFGGNYYIIKIKSGEAGTILYDYASATGKGGLMTNSTEKFVAVPYTYDTTKTGYWFLMHKFDSDTFVKIKYQGEFYEPVYQKIGNVHRNDSLDNGTNRGAAGQMKVNDVGTRIALAVEAGKFFEIFTFNTANGNISNPMQVPAGNLDDKFTGKFRAYGVEFSPTGRYGFDPTSGNYLYGTTRDGQVYQWNLSFYDSRDLTQFIKNGQIRFSNPEVECGALQIASNGKIYMAFKGKDYLGVIHSPKLPNCKFEEKGTRLINNDTGLGGLSGLGLPSKIPVLKNPEPFYFENLCLGDETHFYINDQSGNIISRNWVIAKVSGGIPVNKTSPTNDFRYTFPSAGKYKVLLIILKGGTPWRYTRELTINPLPAVQLIENNTKDTVQLCRGTSLNLDAGYGAFYEWELDTINDRKRIITTNDNEFYHEYRVQVTDYHGCVGWDTVTIRKEIPPTTTHTTVKAFCGRHDGSATVIPNGNIANFTYTWENFPNEKSNTLSGINGGDYIVHVFRPSTGCSVADTIHVDELGGSSVKIVSSGDSIVCPGVPVTLTVPNAAEIEWITPSGLSGTSVNITLDTTTIVSINVRSSDAGRDCWTPVTDTIRVFLKNPPELPILLTPCGGKPVFIDGGEKYLEWIWSDGQITRFAQVNHDENALVLFARDHNQCVFADTVTVHFLPGPDINLGKDTAVCSRDPITLRGGTGDTYLWNKVESAQSIPLGTTQTMQVNQTGDYSLTISKDGCSLSDTIHVQLNDPNLLHIDSVLYKDITCHGAGNGSIRIVAGGDGRDFYYSIDNGSTYLDNKGLFNQIRSGNSYSVKVLEDSVCTATYPLPVTISQPDSLMAKFCTLPPSSKDSTDGVITVASITGGTPPYVIRMNGIIRDTTVIEGLGIGSHTFTITDSLRCEITDTVVLAEGTRPEIVPTVNEAICSGAPVTLRVVNSTRVEWINPPDISNLEILVHPLVTTTYRVKSIKKDADNFSCITILDYTVVVKPFIKPNLGEDIKKCNGDTVELHGGDYVSWEWNNGMVGRDIILMQSPPDPLILSVTDITGCVLKDSISVRFSPHPTVELGKDQAVCSSEPVVLNGGTGDSYLWSPLNLTTNARTREISVSKSGKYYLEITTNGCSSIDSINIKILDPNSFNINSVNPTDNSCFGGAIGSLEIDVNGSGTSFQYSIDGGATYQTSNLFENLPSGGYSQIRVSGDSLCYKDYPETVEIGQPDSIHVTYRLKSPGCETCNDGQLVLEISGGKPPYQITLSGVPIGLITETLGIGSYSIVITDANLCSKTIDFTLEKLNVVPNVITTNGDGVNDRWKIPMLKYYPDAIVKVFSAAGTLVFESPPGYPIPWDGRESGNQLPMGTYYYLINLGPGEQQLTGYLTILR